MKTVLCYGDSNTYGYNPKDSTRFPKSVRWTGILQSLLDEKSAYNAVKAYLTATFNESDEAPSQPGPSFRIIEEGCNGRTTTTDDPFEGWKNGLTPLPPCLNTHKPVDIVILMLGTNDLKEVFHKTAAGIAKDAGRLVETIKKVTKEKQGFVPKIILVSPPLIGEDMPSSVFSTAFAPRSIEESKLFSENFQAIAEEKGCRFFDAARYAPPSKEDSLHFNEAAHRALALALFPVVWEEATCRN